MRTPRLGQVRAKDAEGRGRIPVRFRVGTRGAGLRNHSGVYPHESPPFLGKLVFGKAFLLDHRSGHFGVYGHGWMFCFTKDVGSEIDSKCP